MATNKYDGKVLAKSLLWPKVYTDACIIKSGGSYHSECHCHLSPSVYSQHFPLPFLSQAWDTRNKARKNQVLYHDRAWGGVDFTMGLLG